MFKRLTQLLIFEAIAIPPINQSKPPTASTKPPTSFAFSHPSKQAKTLPP